MSCEGCPSKGNCGKNAASCGVVNNPKNKIHKIIGIMSGKGGVGKSSVTVLFAKDLAKRGYKVGIMDADITGPSIPRLLGLEKSQAYGTNDAIEPVISEEGIKCISLNFLMEDENQPVVWRGPIVANAVKQFYTDVVWGELDYLLIDMPPGTGACGFNRFTITACNWCGNGFNTAANGFYDCFKSNQYVQTAKDSCSWSCRKYELHSMSKLQ